MTTPIEWSQEERRFNDQLYLETCEGMADDFKYLVDTEEISRMPSKDEMKKLQKIIREKIDDGSYADYTGARVALLCSFTDITTTVDP